MYVDGRDLARFEPRTVRRQFGVVVQDGVLQQGNVLDNIIGVSDDLTTDDAWRAACLVDLDRDIRSMPMGWFTVVGGARGTLSGGQAQRIRIASVLMRNPRILFLAETTSWLDARSQSNVMENSYGLAVTRVVVAHRLSTIRRADRIYALSAGHIIQEGSFDELFEQEGPFQ